jgi:hypothetical protein
MLRQGSRLRNQGVIIKHRGAKSPKSTRKQAAQKQARAAATKQKGRAGFGARKEVFLPTEISNEGV